MDRDELQERIRARRSGGEPYRRGASLDEPAYERFEPDPNDARARRGRQADDRRADLFAEPSGAARAVGADQAAGPPEITRDRDEWARAAGAPLASAAPPPVPLAPPPSDVPMEEEPTVAPAYAEPRQPAYDQPQYVDHYDDEAYQEAGYRYEYDEWDERRERRSGAGAFAILGFLALGVLALLGGALLAGVFSGEPSTGAGPTVTPSASAAPTEAASPSPTPAPTGDAASGSPAASGEPVVFPDGFTAEAQPCIPGSAGVNGCDSNGATNGGSVEIWVGFTNGNASDVIGATLVAPDGTTRDGSIDLARINCRQACNGYTYFPFNNLAPGTYEVQITRNGEPAGSTSFEVS